MLWQWAKRRHRNKSRGWVRARYFTEYKNRQWVFAVREKDVNGTSTWKRLVEISDIPIRRHVKIRAEANPYDPKWEGYFEAREQRAMAHEFRGPLRNLWRRQNGSCLVCRQQITSDTRWNVHHVVWKVFGGSDRVDNLALLHPDCHRQVHSRRTTVVHRVLRNSAFEGLEPDAGKLARPVVRPVKAGAFSGNRPAKAKARSLVAWMAGRRETDDLKPIDRIVVRTIASHRAVAQANAKVAPKMRGPGGRAHNRRAKAASSVVGWLTRHSTPAGW